MNASPEITGRIDFSFYVPTANEALTYVASAGIIFGGVVPYVPQYYQIQKTENADGFSMYVCLSLLIANTLRILFWFGRRFELPLLLQSVLMNIAMLTLIELCVRVRSKSLIIPPKNRYFLEGEDHFSLSRDLSQVPAPKRKFRDLDFNYFWAWTDFISYVECICAFALIFGALTYYLLDSPWYIETIGYMALITEALLALPQLLKNHAKKSTVGMSVNMVALWLAGDLFKTIYFFVRKAPLQFQICGVIQVCVDICILCQVFYYRAGTKKLHKGEYVS